MKYQNAISNFRTHAPQPAKSLYRRARLAILYPRHRGHLDEEFDRIYHIHIRKCAGSSINAAFLDYFSAGSATIEQLAKSEGHRINFKKGPVAGWHRMMLERGAFAYGFSHIPYHTINLPPRTFTFTFLRDPSDRLISHFKMLKDMIAAKSNHPAMKTEAWWAEGTFSEFLDRIPRAHLENQLYMFDAEFDADRALTRLAEVNHVSLADQTQEILHVAKSRFEIDLQYEHRRKSSFSPTLTCEETSRMHDMLSAEYDFFKRAKKLFISHPKV